MIINKFKAKRLENKEWCYGAFWDKPLRYGHEALIYLEDAEEVFFMADTGWVTIDRKTLGQYTGLKDKNGKEIYEGDICWTYEIGIGNLNRVVVFDEGSFCFDHNKTLRTELRGWKKDYIEVIGNIYENPELINV